MSAEGRRALTVAGQSSVTAYTTRGDNYTGWVSIACVCSSLSVVPLGVYVKLCVCVCVSGGPYKPLTVLLHLTQSSKYKLKKKTLNLITCTLNS